ncbi:MAG TPA: prepilin-type N-terminal cleavage/methylation domain-containing protein [Candidatus Avacidaminococcus intestinavium]|uniref:Prepilin-type N-terminal cleavage/methylation domain-containing protein n=1 Tax=Candidatus Avacidaminococcus intestinavium TaxID=2840684 RepID=A0A9D1MQ11_9FIRM|nr:prepilin-type N-terminal cleavage/methylation domain-containing protein [Candidatus Avacidaminococcus intestinavium]
MERNQHSLNRGFTLVELVVVIAILGLLASIAVPRFLDAQAQARGSKILADLNTCEAAINLYYMRNGHFPTDSDALDEEQLVGNYLAAWPMPPVGRALINAKEIIVEQGAHYIYVGQAETELTTRVGRVKVEVAGGAQTVDELLAAD